jgi:ABC-type sugar transport system substrate-binding protein
MRRRKMFTSAAAFCGALALTSLAACSSGSPSTSSAGGGGGGATAAAASVSACLNSVGSFLDSYEQPAKLTMPPPIPAAKVAALKGKTVWFVADSMTNSLDIGVWTGFEAAAKAAGMVPKVYDTGGTVSGYNQGVLEAVGQHAAGIVLGEFDATDAGGAVQQAGQNHIPVVGSFEPNFNVPGYSGYMNENEPLTGQLMAAPMLMGSNCSPNVFIITANVFTNVQQQTNSEVAYIKKYCPSCNVKVQNIDVSQIASTAGSLTSSALTANPNIDYMSGAFDAIDIYMIPPIQAAHSKALVVGSTGGPANLKIVAQGGTQIADVMAAPDPVDGWMDFDQLLRAMTGVPQAAEWHSIPLQVVTKSNQAALLKYPGFANYQCKFEQDWGLSCGS